MSGPSNINREIKKKRKVFGAGIGGKPLVSSGAG